MLNAKCLLLSLQWRRSVRLKVRRVGQTPPVYELRIHHTVPGHHAHHRTAGSLCFQQGSTNTTSSYECLYSTTHRYQFLKIDKAATQFRIIWIFFFLIFQQHSSAFFYIGGSGGGGRWIVVWSKSFLSPPPSSILHLLSARTSRASAKTSCSSTRTARSRMRSRPERTWTACCWRTCCRPTWQRCLLARIKRTR